MANEVKYFSKQLMEQLYDGNEFILKSVNHNPFVNGASVGVPQGGTKPSITANRSSLPASVSERSDSELVYSLTELTTDPILLSDSDMRELNYDKAKSILQSYVDALNERMGQQFLVDVATNTVGRHIYTTGTATASIAPPSGTGNRNAVAIEDFFRMGALFGNDKGIPKADRWCVMPETMYWNMIAENPELKSLEYSPSSQAVEMGAIKSVAGFNIITRSVVAVYTNAQVKKAIGAVGAATDNFAAICWQSNSVAKAQSEIKVFLEKDSPVYYGDVMSALTRFAGQRLRTDEAGVGILMQA